MLAHRLLILISAILLGTGCQSSLIDMPKVNTTSTFKSGPIYSNPSQTGSNDDPSDPPTSTPPITPNTPAPTNPPTTPTNPPSSGLALFTQNAGVTTYHPRDTIVSYGFIEYLPEGYDAAPNGTYPLVIFLHGGGEAGNGGTLESLQSLRNDKTTLSGVQYLVDHGKYYNTIVLTPQAIASDLWWSNVRLNELLDYAVAHYKVDPKRILVTGYSMGGGMVWDWVGENAYRIAAAMPISGNTVCSAQGTANIVAQGIKIWSFHANDDNAVNIDSAYSCMNYVGNLLGNVTTVQGERPVESGYKAVYNVTQNDMLTGHLDQNSKTWSFENEFDCADSSGNTWAHPHCMTEFHGGGHFIFEHGYEDPLDRPMTWFMQQRRP